jgi:membrane associated rhomboid family serine protease
LSSIAGGSSWRGLMLATFIVFVGQVLLGDPSGTYPSLVDRWLALDVEPLWHGQVWRLATYAFLHDRQDLLHLLFNMLTLWWAGRAVEPLYGSREFLWFYMAAAVVGGIGFALWDAVLGLSSGVVGASGAVMAVLMLYACHFPRDRIYLFGLIGIEARWLVALFALFDLLPVLNALGGGHGSHDRVAHIVHLTGLAFGWLYVQRRWRLSSGWRRLTDSLRQRWRLATAGRRLKVYDPEPDDEPVDLDADVDRILAKIHEQGTGSLTPREQAILTRASERYKKRS